MIHKVRIILVQMDDSLLDPSLLQVMRNKAVYNSNRFRHMFTLETRNVRTGVRRQFTTYGKLFQCSWLQSLSKVIETKRGIVRRGLVLQKPILEMSLLKTISVKLPLYQ